MKKRILIVEDNLVAARVEKFTIQSIDKDYEINCVPSGEEGVFLTCKEKYDLILMDLGLEGIDGVEATKRIRANHSAINNSLTPIVVVTANKNSSEYTRCFDAGANDVICKPLTLEKAKSVMLNFCSAG